ncbi:ARM repeat-containing protein [Fomitiporia mediterranea MF3/22]|uniref:ARM repeat-containing protein n=1 Tax=Fomitiporia mediterranea (strain MF3/22) TaxID=694068 RepID=UPI00044092CB|nr:ARM repeat-containing protein [Fomitiporia mediterranea MF3/22]EJD04736.1 ARM repeat-containing protein [Fomitiporia mediterranea MF3/22]
MIQVDFLPVLSQSDIEQAAFLIQSAYIPGQDVEESRRMQQQLFEIQKRPEAWGLVLPLLDHPDPNVEFFGAHTAQVKIVRDWDLFPKEHALQLAFVLLAACSRIIAAGKSKVTLRKLFVSVTSLALKLVPGRPSQWPDWILSVMTTLSGSGARSEHVLEFLEIAAEEVGSSDMTSASKTQMQQSMRDAAPLVTESVRSTLLSSTATKTEKDAAFKCLEAWISTFNANDLTSLIPILIQLLSHEDTFVGASDVLQEILSSSSFSDGSGVKTLTEPLLVFLETGGAAIVQQTLSTGEVDEISRSLCKLLVALGEHSINYIATHLSQPRVQTFVRLLFSYTALPGSYGVDEDESEMTLSFWYLLQEALWTVDYGDDLAEAALEDWAESVQGGGTSRQGSVEPSRPDYGAATPIYTELVQVLKRKVTWPEKTELARWTKDQIDAFQVYRRDVGDTLINAFYILRSDMLKIYVEELVASLNSRRQSDGWENVEAILHCIMSVQEAVDISPNTHLERVFGPEVIGRLPRSGHDRVRRTALGLIGAYATWFTVPIDNRYLLGALSYVAEALDESTLCLPAANALRELCDANRAKLADHIAEFGQLHARLPSIPDSEKAKIVQSIASVIQALPPEQEIEPVNAIVSPVVSRLSEALSTATQLPEEARALAIQQLQTLTGCAKGLTRTSDILFAYDDDADKAEMEKMQQAREDSRMRSLREGIIQGTQGVMLQWSTDALTADALNGLIVAITALPADMTLLSLPPAPLLQIVCGAMQRHPNAVWLSLAAMLIHQLDPPSLTSLLAVPSSEAKETVLTALPIILDSCLRYLQPDGAMEANPDIVQAFFGCMEMVSQHFAGLFFQLPQGAVEALMQCSVKALTLQERYSLVAACKFLVYLIQRTVSVESLEEQGRALVRTHFRPVVRAVLCGIGGSSPTSTAQNLVDLLLALVTRCPNECKAWVPEILFSDEEFIPTKAQRPDKEKFAKAVLSSRSTKRMRDAAQQFALVAKGLEGSNFGYASVTM